MATPLSVDQLDWSSRDKQLSRLAYIHAYRNIIADKMDADRQYWTLAGQCGSMGGMQLQGCEIDHVVNVERLITIDQFHGVELNADIDLLNRQAWPLANWYSGDIYQEIINADARGQFNPSIINIDTTLMPRRGALLAGRIMSLISEMSELTNVVVAVNLCFTYRHHHYNVDQALEQLRNDRYFNHALTFECWQQMELVYQYKTNRAGMGTFIFHKT